MTWCIYEYTIQWHIQTNPFGSGESDDGSGSSSEESFDRVIDEDESGGASHLASFTGSPIEPLRIDQIDNDIQDLIRDIKKK